MMGTRRSVGLAALALILFVVIVDLISSKPPNPYTQPPVLALGSGQAASGAMCAATPPK